MEDEIYNLIRNIEKLRNKLDLLVEENPRDLTHREIYELSAELDGLLARFIKIEHSIGRDDRKGAPDGWSGPLLVLRNSGGQV